MTAPVALPDFADRAEKGSPRTEKDVGPQHAANDKEYLEPCHHLAIGSVRNV